MLEELILSNKCKEVLFIIFMMPNCKIKISVCALRIIFFQNLNVSWGLSVEQSKHLYFFIAMNTELWEIPWKWENTELCAGLKLTGCFNPCYNQRLDLVLEFLLLLLGVFLSHKLRLIQNNFLNLLLFLISKISPKQQ